jgi:hypothetical protein
MNITKKQRFFEVYSSSDNKVVILSSAIGKTALFPPKGRGANGPHPFLNSNIRRRD